MKWAINLDGEVIEIPKVIIWEIRANLTRVIGWFNRKLKKGVEKHLSVNKGECKKRLLTTLGSIVGGDVKPMVAVSNRWPHAEGGEKDSLAIHSSDLTNPHLM